MFNQYGGFGIGELYAGAQAVSILLRLLILGGAFGIGYLLAAPKFAHIRLYVLLGLVALYALLVPLNPIDGLAAVVIFAVAFITFRAREKNTRPRTFGSSHWATLEEIQKLNLENDDGQWLGKIETASGESKTLRYSGPRHLFTSAPGRTGKGTSVVIPTLQTYEGSMLVIDPKAENAIRTAERRAEMGQEVYLLDPFDLTGGNLPAMPRARLNPVDWVGTDSGNEIDNAMLLAGAIVKPAPGSKEQFWDEEAKAVIAGTILHVATSPSEEGNRHLPRVRDILSMPEDELETVLVEMAASRFTLVSGTAKRTASKDPKLRSSIFATAQSHTHWLENPAIRDSLSASDFDFADLKVKRQTTYLILPSDRLEAYSPWLRIMVQQAITTNARNIIHQPERPVLFLLDEMAALGNMPVLLTAYGLMAGYGMKLWAIVQDLSQLKRHYGDGWETFISNSGVVQYFGSRDVMTAEYFSKLCGKTTVKSFSIANVFAKERSSTETVSEAQRDLAYADELMTLRDGKQLLFVESSYPILAERTPWYSHPVLKRLGRHLPGEPGYRQPEQDQIAAE